MRRRAMTHFSRRRDCHPPGNSLSSANEAGLTAILLETPFFSYEADNRLMNSPPLPPDAER
jgi:hypothetical protein